MSVVATTGYQQPKSRRDEETRPLLATLVARVTMR